MATVEVEAMEATEATEARETVGAQRSSVLIDETFPFNKKLPFEFQDSL